MKRLLVLLTLVLVTGCSEDRSRCESLYEGFQKDGQAEKFAYNEEQWIARCEDDLGGIK